MSLTTKLNLTNREFKQTTGTTLNLSGDTIIYGDLRYGITPVFTGSTDIASVGFVTGITSQLGGGGSGSITGGTNGLSTNGFNINLGGLITGDTYIGGNGSAIIEDLFTLRPSGTTFPTAFSGIYSIKAAYTIVIDNNGKYLVGGAFTSYSGITVNRLVRLNTDGTLDNTFNVGTGPNDNANTIITTVAVHSGGTIIVGGQWTSWNGVSAQNIVRLNSNGAVINYAQGTGFNSAVTNIKIGSNDSIYVCGGWTAYNGVTVNKVVKMDLSLVIDGSFTVGTLNQSVQRIAITPDQKIYATGYFSTLSGTTQNGIVRFNPDGTKDSTFNIGTGFDNTTVAVTVLNDGKIYVGGRFTTYKGLFQRGIVRLNPNGDKDVTFDVNSGITATSGWLGPHEIVLDNDNKIYIAGQHTAWQGNTSLAGTLSLNDDGTLNTTFNGGNVKFFQGYCIVYDAVNSCVIVVGNTDSLNNFTVGYIAKLNLSGVIIPFFSTANKGFNASITKMKKVGEYYYLYGSSLGAYNTTLTFRLLRLNSDGTVSKTYNFTDNPSVFEVSTGHTLFIGSTTKIDKYDFDGNLIDTKLYDGTFYSTSLLQLDEINDHLYVFTWNTMDGITPTRGLERLSMSTLVRDVTFNSGGTGMGLVGPSQDTVPSPRGMLKTSDGKFYVYGTIRKYNFAQNARDFKGIFRMNSDGSYDSTFGGNGFNTVGVNVDPEIYSGVIDSSDNVFLSGYFDKYNGIKYSNDLIKINPNGTGDTSFYFDYYGEIVYPTNPTNFTAMVYRNNIIYGVGSNTTYKGRPSVLIALNPTTGEIYDGQVYRNNTTKINTIISSFILEDDKLIFSGGLIGEDVRFGNVIAYNLINNISITENLILKSDVSSKFPIVYESDLLSLYQDRTIPDWINVKQYAESVLQSDNALTVLNGKVELGGNLYKNTLIESFGYVNPNLTSYIDPDFNPEIIYPSNANVNLVRVDPNTNKIYVSGSFDQIDGTIIYKIARLHEDGTVDTGFTSGYDIAASGTLLSDILIQPDGKILLCATVLGTYNGVTYANDVIRLNVDGTVDTGFTYILTANTTLTLGIQSTGKILVGRSSSNPQLLRLNANGSQDGTFPNPIPVGQVSIIRVFPDDRIVAFSFSNSIFVVYSPEGVDTGAYTYVSGSLYDIRIDSDGKMILGGTVTAYGLTVVNKIFRINADGSYDSTFISPTFNEGTTSVRKIQISYDQYLVNGVFTSVNGVPCNNFVILNYDGSVDTRYDFTSGVTTTAGDFARLNNGDIIYSGNFDSFNGTPATCLVKLPLSFAELTLNKTLLKYNADYSADMVERSIPDVGYVNSLLANQISVSGATNIGGETNGLYTTNSGNTIHLKSLRAGTNVTLVPSTTGITISAVSNLAARYISLSVKANIVITTGLKGYILIPYSGTISQWYARCYPAATITLDVWSLNQSHPTNGNSITASAKPTITSGVYNTSTTLTGWGLNVSEGNFIALEVENNDLATEIELILKIV